MNWIKRFFTSLYARFKREQTQTTIQGLIDLAKTLAEPISKIDWDGDGRIAAAKEVQEAAARLGFKTLKQFQGLTIDEILDQFDAADIKRALLTARFVLVLVERFSGQVPLTRTVNWIIETAVAMLDPVEVENDLAEKGITL